MDVFNEYLSKIGDNDQCSKMNNILSYIDETYNLNSKVAWNQPMFTDHETFIIGLSIAKKHISIAVEPKTIDIFKENILDCGYECTKNLFKIKDVQDIDYQLIDKLICFNIEDKKNCATFFR